MECKNNGKYNDLKTENQWLKEKKVPKEDATGIRLWSNHFYNNSFIYYSIDEVRPISEKEILQLKEKYHLKYLAAKERRKKKDQERKKIELDAWNRHVDESIEAALYSKCKPIAKELMRMASNMPSIKCNNPSKIIVLDTETTGLSIEKDEILQISIIDGEGNVLINEYVKPYWKNNWDEAEKVHHIKQTDVLDALYPHEIIPKVKGIFESANILVAYNSKFDLDMLKYWGIEPLSHQKIYDVMLEFASIYGKWNEKFETYEWQTLTTCAAYYKYKFDAHDSLEDVKATLHCYKCIMEEKKEC